MKTFSVEGYSNSDSNSFNISAFNLQKSFGRFSLHINNLQLTSGEIYGLIGANGCGKSTAVKLLAGLLQPDAGEIKYENLTCRDITLVQQKPYVMRDSVMANLTYPLKLRKIKPDNELLDYYLELAGLQNLKHAYAPGLSGGETQKLALIRAMVFSPKVIFVDETFSNMDMESQENFENLILHGKGTKSLYSSGFACGSLVMLRRTATETSDTDQPNNSFLEHENLPVIRVIISHQLSVIKRLCDYIFFMDNGKIEAEGETNEIFTNPQNKSLEKYLTSQFVPR